MTTTTQFLATHYAARYPDRVARTLEQHSPERAAAFLQECPTSVAAAVLGAMHPQDAAVRLNVLAREAAVAAIGEMSFHQAAAIVRRLARTDRQVLIEALPPRVSRRLRRSLEYMEGTAGALADPNIPVASSLLSVQEVRKRVSKGGTDGPYVYLIDKENRLVGVTTPDDLGAARPDTPVSAVMKRQVRSLAAHLEFGDLASAAAWTSWDVLPVVGASGVLLGAIRHRMLRQSATMPTRPATGALETVMEISESYWTMWAALLASVGHSTHSRTPNASAAEE